MQRNRQIPKKALEPSLPPSLGTGGRSLERHLLEFLDRLDLYLFLYEPSYRRCLNTMLERFSDEEFERFARAHSQRFTLN